MYQKGMNLRPVLMQPKAKEKSYKEHIDIAKNSNSVIILATGSILDEIATRQ